MIMAVIAQKNLTVADGDKKINICFYVSGGSFELYREFQSACPKWTSQLYNVGQKVFIKAKHIKGNQIQQTQEALFPHTDCLMKTDIKLKDMERLEFKTVHQNPVTIKQLNDKLIKESSLAKLKLVNLQVPLIVYEDLFQLLHDSTSLFGLLRKEQECSDERVIDASHVNIWTSVLQMGQLGAHIFFSGSPMNSNLYDVNVESYEQHKG